MDRLDQITQEVLQTASPELVQKMLTAAVAVIQTIGHSHRCQFSGCTCGQVESMKLRYAEFMRFCNEFESGGVVERQTHQS